MKITVGQLRKLISEGRPFMGQQVSKEDDNLDFHADKVITKAADMLRGGLYGETEAADYIETQASVSTRTAQLAVSSLKKALDQAIDTDDLRAAVSLEKGKLLRFMKMNRDRGGQ